MDVLVKKLRQFASVSEADAQALADAVQDVRLVPAGGDIIREGDKAAHVHLLLDGWAVRYKHLADGGRSIMAVLVPGDICDVHAGLLRAMDHSLGVVGEAEVAYFSRGALDTLFERGGLLTKALFCSTLVDEAILREWLLNIGRRPAGERLAHLLCELSLRLGAVGLTVEDGYRLPLSQIVLADMLGLTPVHINRTLKTLGKANLVSLDKKELTIPNLERLIDFAGFDPSYLHQLNNLADDRSPSPSKRRGQEPSLGSSWL